MPSPSPFIAEEIAEIKADITGFTSDAPYYFKRLIATVEAAAQQNRDLWEFVRAYDDFMQAYTPHFREHGFVDRDDLDGIDAARAALGDTDG